MYAHDPRPGAPGSSGRGRGRAATRGLGSTPNPPTDIVDFRGFDSSTILI